MAHRKRLRHAHQRVVDAGVAVRVVVAEDLADHGGTFPISNARSEIQIPHRVQDAAMNDFQAVARVRNGATDDDAHRIVEIRSSHLVLDAHRVQVGGTGLAFHAKITGL